MISSSLLSLSPLSSSSAIARREMRLPATPGGRSRAGERGFTLLELLVVLAILGLMIGLVAPRVMHIFGRAKVQVARQQIAQLGSVLQIYKLDVGSYPTTAQGLEALVTRPTGVSHWDGPYFQGNKVPKDPWGHPYIYRFPSERPGHAYDLISLGPSGRPGGEGEIENE